WRFVHQPGSNMEPFLFQLSGDPGEEALDLLLLFISVGEDEVVGKTTGWIHRATLLARGVKMIPAVSYEKIDDEGLHVTIGGERQLLAVDQVVICAGQEPRRELADPLRAAGKTVHLIGGCDVAAELDARRAIAQGTKLALAI
ncbi:hypothetical protein PRR77_10065, partial [Klebsiella pneumoniae]|nr:hypothetical protein [Klebsiella pneumoniae]